MTIQPKNHAYDYVSIKKTRRRIVVTVRVRKLWARKGTGKLERFVIERFPKKKK